MRLSQKSTTTTRLSEVLPQSALLVLQHFDLRLDAFHPSADVFSFLNPRREDHLRNVFPVDDREKGGGGGGGKGGGGGGWGPAE